MRVATGLLVFAAVGVACAIALGWNSGLDQTAAIISLAVALLAGGISAKVARPAKDETRPTVADRVMITVFALATLRAFLWLITINGDSYQILSPYNLGDLSLHIGLIRFFAGGEPFWPENPILAGEPLRYPVGADLFNSLLLLIGVGVHRGLIWTGLIAGGVTVFALWKWGRGFAIAAFLFAGGLAGFVVFREVLEGSGFPIRDFTADAGWKNLFLTMFVTQRGLLFALPAGLLLMADWRRRFLQGKPGEIPLFVHVILYAAMPVFSPHAFLFLSVVLVGIFVFGTVPGARLRLIAIAAASVVPATTAAWLVTAGFSASSGIRWHPGWMQEGNPVNFWVWNFGLSLPLAALLVGVVAFRGSSVDRAFVLPAALVFLACCFVSFAPWPWDNTKLMVWSWLTVAPTMWAVLIRPLPQAWRALVCVLLFLTGALSLLGGLGSQHGYRLIARSLLDESAVALHSLDRSARIAAAPDYWHPVILLGYKTAVGYEGHLWSHGLDYHERLRDLETVLLQQTGWESAVENLGVRYLFDGEPERLRYPGSQTLWTLNLKPAYQSPRLAIYDLERDGLGSFGNESDPGDQ